MRSEREIKGELMGFSETDLCASSEGDKSASESRKAAERRRLAEALRANLSRRKAQSRERRAKAEDAKDCGGEDPKGM